MKLSSFFAFFSSLYWGLFTLLFESRCLPTSKKKKSKARADPDVNYSLSIAIGTLSWL